MKKSKTYLSSRTAIVQRSANWPVGQCGPPIIFINKVSLEHGKLISYILSMATCAL